MTDTVMPAKRSWIMSRIKPKDTKPEMVVRRTAHALGYRYRLHRRDLPGTPDLVFQSRRAVVFVQGCFWHRHDCDNGRKMPKSNVDFWREKFRRNTERELRNIDALVADGWRVLEIWECELKKRPESLAGTLVDFLGPLSGK